MSPKIIKVGEMVGKRGLFIISQSCNGLDKGMEGNGILAIKFVCKDSPGLSSIVAGGD